MMDTPVTIDTSAKLTAVLSIGANLDHARENIASVFNAFGDATIARSKVYATPPWGGVEQGDFLNAIVIVQVESTPRQLLERCWELENAAGRVREIKWGPRSLDVDIIQIRPDGHTNNEHDGTESGELPTELISDDPTLTLPHPWAAKRAFVLVSWAEVEPEAKLASTPIRQLIADLDADEVAAVKVSP